MAAKDVRAGRAFLEIYLKDGVSKELEKTGKVFKEWGKTITAIGASITAGGTLITGILLGAAKSAASAGAAIYDMSQRTGLSAEEISKLGFAADMTGTSIESVEGAVKKMQKTIGDAAGGSKSAAAEIELLGLGVASLSAMNPDQQFEAVASAIASIENPTEQAAAAMRIFGKSGTDIIPLIKSFPELKKQAEDFSLVITTEQAKIADAFDDAFTLASKVVKSLTNEIGSALLPMLTKTADVVTTVLVETRNWAKQNQELIRTIFKIGTGALVVGAVITVLGGALVATGVVISSIGAIIGGVTAAVGAVASVVTGVLASGLGIAAVAAAGVGAAYLVMSDSVKDAARYIGNIWADVSEDVRTAMAAISLAVAGGDIKKSAQILWAFLKLEWTKGTKGLWDTWNDFSTKFLSGWDAFATDLINRLFDLAAEVNKFEFTILYNVKAAWEEVKSFFKDDLPGEAKYELNNAKVIGETKLFVQSKYDKVLTEEDVREIGAQVNPSDPDVGFEAKKSLVGREMTLDEYKQLIEEIKKVKYEASDAMFAAEDKKLDAAHNEAMANIWQEYQAKVAAIMKIAGLEKDKYKETSEAYQKKLNATLHEATMDLALKLKVAQSEFDELTKPVESNTSSSSSNKGKLKTPLSEMLKAIANDALSAIPDSIEGEVRGMAKTVGALAKESLSLVPPALRGTMEAIKQSVTAYSTSFDSRGTFNPKAILSLQASAGGSRNSAQEDTSRYAKSIYEAIGEILRRLPSDPTFAE